MRSEADLGIKGMALFFQSYTYNCISAYLRLPDAFGAPKTAPHNPGGGID